MRFTEAAAKRLAFAARLVENDNTGYAHGYITTKPHTVEQEARHLVNEWFAACYGWPLTSREWAERDAFLDRVMHYIKEQP